MTESSRAWVQGPIDGVITAPPGRHDDERGWLSEIFRSDELLGDVRPAMGYISVTRPGRSRGPHAHSRQSDYFLFTHVGKFLLKLWDNRPDSKTAGNLMSITAGGENALLVIVPPGVIHGYKNISTDDGIVMNFPDALYAGEGRKSPVDESRYEDVDDCDFSMDDEPGSA